MHFPPDLPLIETPRLWLRPFSHADARAVQSLAGAHEVADTTANIPHPYLDGMAETWIDGHRLAWEKHQHLSLAITAKPEAQLVGAVGLVFAAEHDRADLGYWIGVPFWKNGFATEAAGAVVDFGFRVMGLQRVQAHHFARNSASGHVMLKLGMKREGIAPRAFKKHERYEDLVHYGLLRRDWPGCGSTPPFAVRTR